MTEADRRQGERRQEGRRQGDRREGARRQNHDRKTHIELAKHIGVLSVGLSVMIHGVITSSLSESIIIAALSYAGSIFVLTSFCFSAFIIFSQLSYIKKKTSKYMIRYTVVSFTLGATTCFFALILPVLHKIAEAIIHLLL